VLLLFVQLREALYLLIVFIIVATIQPSFEHLLSSWPLAFNDAEIDAIPTMTLDNHMIPKYPFEELLFETLDYTHWFSIRLDESEAARKMPSSQGRTLQSPL